MVDRDKTLLSDADAKQMLSDIVSKANKELMDPTQVEPKKRDMILRWALNKLTYLYTERKYNRLKEKRKNYSKNKRLNEADPSHPLSAKLSGKEKTFMKKYEKEYLPGDIIKVDFGFNVGREYGGEHYAVVFRSSGKYENMVYVIPLTSVKEDKELFTTDYEIGVVRGLNLDPRSSDVSSAAKLMSSLEVSKFRLFESGKVYDRLSKHDTDNLREAFFKTLFAEEYKTIRSLEKKIEELTTGI